MRIFLVRHGDPHYPTDSLTEAGQREAAALVPRFQKQGLDAIFCSPLGRARATAAPTAAALGLEAQILPWTAELRDPWTIEPISHGIHCAWDLHGECIRDDPRSAQGDQWHRIEALAGRGLETAFAGLAAASDAWIESLGYRREGGRYRILRSQQQRIALFAHGGFGLTWVAHLLGLPPPLTWSGFFLPTSSVTTILFDERSETWAVPRCLGVGDLAHLAVAGLAPSNSGIKANMA